MRTCEGIIEADHETLWNHEQLGFAYVRMVMCLYAVIKSGVGGGAKLREPYTGKKGKRAPVHSKPNIGNAIFHFALPGRIEGVQITNL